MWFVRIERLRISFREGICILGCTFELKRYFSWFWHRFFVFVFLFGNALWTILTPTDSRFNGASKQWQELYFRLKFAILVICHFRSFYNKSLVSSFPLRLLNTFVRSDCRLCRVISRVPRKKLLVAGKRRVIASLEGPSLRNDWAKGQTKLQAVLSHIAEVLFAISF